MSNYESLLKPIVEGLYDVFLESRSASNSVEHSVLSFNNDIEILERMREIKFQEERGRNLNFRCNGDTLIGLALKNAILQIEARKKAYNEKKPRLRYFSPIIILISDGKPNCSNATIQMQDNEAMRFCKSYIYKEVKAGRLVIISVGRGDKWDYNFMRELTGLPTDKYVTKIENYSNLENFREFVLDLFLLPE